MGVQDRSRCQDTAMLVRGELDQPAQIVPRGMPTVLADQPIKIPSDHSGRLELAKWLTAPSHPLTASGSESDLEATAWARLGAYHRGLWCQRNSSNASRIARPLSYRFIEQNWSTKDLIRQITSSHVYRISSAVTDQAFNRDPDNELLWRYQPKRLEAEQLRDAMLLVSGRLDLNPPQASEVAKLGYTQVRDGNLIGPAQVMAMSGMQMDDMEMARGNMGGMMGRQDFARELNRRDPERFRQLIQDRRRGNDQVDMVQSTYRSIYLPIIRDQLPRSLEVFDYPDSSIISGQRESSSTANQALFLLNNDFVHNRVMRLPSVWKLSQPIVLTSRSGYQSAMVAKRNERKRSLAMQFLQAYESSTNYSASLRSPYPRSVSAVCVSRIPSYRVKEVSDVSSHQSSTMAANQCHWPGLSRIHRSGKPCRSSERASSSIGRLNRHHYGTCQTGHLSFDGRCTFACGYLRL